MNAQTRTEEMQGHSQVQHKNNLTSRQESMKMAIFENGMLRIFQTDKGFTSVSRSTPNPKQGKYTKPHHGEVAGIHKWISLEVVMEKTEASKNQQSRPWEILLKIHCQKALACARSSSLWHYCDRHWCFSQLFTISSGLAEYSKVSTWYLSSGTFRHSVAPRTMGQEVHITTCDVFLPKIADPES